MPNIQAGGKNMDTRPIGVFDSGVGGLTVVKQMIKTMPNENIIYFGDTARVPYGTKSGYEVFKTNCTVFAYKRGKSGGHCLQHSQLQ